MKVERDTSESGSVGPDEEIEKVKVKVEPK
jgi:hypothetical protein